MKRIRRKNPTPLLVASLAFHSAETIARRAALIASGTCPPNEYARMVGEKVIAAHLSGFALLTGGGPAGALRPWARIARANARRLRKK